MNKLFKFLIILVVLRHNVGYSKETKVNKESIVKGNNIFAFELYAKLKDKKGNLFFSPFSISTALAMTYAGARGNTEKQMAEVLHFELNQKFLHPAFKELINQLNKSQSYQLNIANALWGQKNCGFLKDFLTLVKTNYGAGLIEVDFIKNTESARKTINAWVEKQTENKIKNLIKQGVLTDLTRLVLTNAIYFKGNWASQFDKKKTKEAPFYVKTDKTVQVQMMYQEGDFKFLRTSKFKLIELPYIDNELSMVIILPNEIDGLSEVENSLTLNNLNRWLMKLREQEVHVYLPKFKTTSEFRLKKVLSSMGMPDAFSGNLADFSGMTGKKGLFISAVIHKAFVEVNEEGTEAAAATAVAMECESRLSIFRADRPFIFLIRDIWSGSILFLGRIVNPLE